MHERSQKWLKSAYLNIYLKNCLVNLDETNVVEFRNHYNSARNFYCALKK